MESNSEYMWKSSNKYRPYFLPTSTNVATASNQLNSSPITKKFTLQDLSEIGIDGIPEVIRHPHKSWRIFWIFLITIAFGVMMYELYKTFDDYYNNPILTTYTVIPAKEKIDFPDIYICPTNPVNRSRLEEFNLDPNWIRMLTAMQTAGFDNENAATNGLLARIISNSDNINQIVAPMMPGPTTTRAPPKHLPKANPGDVYNYFMNLGYDTDKFIQECSFNSTIFDHCSSIAEPILDQNYGKCFLISMSKLNYYQVSPGLGLSLFINLNTNYDLMENRSIFDGVHVYIQKKFDPASTSKLLIHPGTYTTLNLQQQDFRLLRVDSGDSKQICLSEKEYPKFKIMNSTSYSLDLCKMDCFQDLIFKKCSCLLMMDPKFIQNDLFERHNALFCDPEKLKNCVYRITRNESEHSEFQECFKQKCHNPCRWTEYQITSSSSNLRLPPPILFSGDYILLNVAFNQMRIIQIQQNPSMTFDTMIGNVGGQISLFFGSSILALIHAILLCTILIRKKIRFNGY